MLTGLQWTFGRIGNGRQWTELVNTYDTFDTNLNTLYFGLCKNHSLDIVSYLADFYNTQHEDFVYILSINSKWKFCTDGFCCSTHSLIWWVRDVKMYNQESKGNRPNHLKSIQRSFLLLALSLCPS